MPARYGSGAKMLRDEGIRSVLGSSHDLSATLLPQT